MSSFSLHELTQRPGTRDRFAALFAHVLDEDLALPPALARRLVERLRRQLDRDAQAAFADLGTSLERMGVRKQWNRTFVVRRAARLARAVRPWIHGSCLDLLCGDGDVGERLAAAGIDVTLCERHAPSRRAGGLPFIGFDELPRAGAGFDCVLLCAVLHHEPDPGALLGLARALAGARIVIVENTLHPDYSMEIQNLADIFFNEYLNVTGDPTPGSHRSAAQWAAALQGHGRIAASAELGRMPGVPLMHHLIVIDLGKQDDLQEEA